MFPISYFQLLQSNSQNGAVCDQATCYECKFSQCIQSFYPNPVRPKTNQREIIYDLDVTLPRLHFEGPDCTFAFLSFSSLLFSSHSITSSLFFIFLFLCMSCIHLYIFLPSLSLFLYSFRICQLRTFQRNCFSITEPIFVIQFSISNLTYIASNYSA